MEKFIRSASIRGDKSTYPLAQLSGGEKLKVALLGLSHAQPMPELYYLMNQKTT